MRYRSITLCDIVNGAGIGVVLWCQGCDCACENCQNKETWDFNAGNEFTEATFDLLLAKLDSPYISRLTLSGGHPLAKQNIETCTIICKKVKELYPNINIWVYTGYNFEQIKNYEILKYIDILVDGKFEAAQRDLTLAFRGSSNQRIIKVKESLERNQIVLYEADED